MKFCYYVTEQRAKSIILILLVKNQGDAIKSKITASKYCNGLTIIRITPMIALREPIIHQTH